MPSSQSWSGVEWSSEGGYFVAVSQTAAVSKDGIIWVAQTAAEVSGAVIWSTLLHRFVAVGPSNAIMTRDLLSVEPSADVGDTSMRIDAVENFQSGGGWFRVEEQVIRYTGRGASTGESTLIGIPATGTLGAILAALPIGASVVPLPAITGVPSSGDGSVLVQLEAGEGVNILITRNDATAQSALATLLGGSADGIFEDYKQDRRLAQDEAENQGDAMLTLGKDLVQEFTWGSRNPNTRSGKTQVVDLTSPQSIDTNYKIQSVSISEIDSRGASHAANTTGKPVSERMPLYRANASTVWFSFEDLIRQMRIGSDSKEA